MAIYTFDGCYAIGVASVGNNPVDGRDDTLTALTNATVTVKSTATGGTLQALDAVTGANISLSTTSTGHVPPFRISSEDARDMIVRLDVGGVISREILSTQAYAAVLSVPAMRDEVSALRAQVSQLTAGTSFAAAKHVTTGEPAPIFWALSTDNVPSTVPEKALVAIRQV